MFDAAVREVKEEVGVEVKNPRFVCITNDIFENEDKHYVTIFIAMDYVSGSAEALENEKSAEAGWYDMENLPAPLFIPLKNATENKCFPGNWKKAFGPVV